MSFVEQAYPSGQAYLWPLDCLGVQFALAVDERRLLVLVQPKSGVLNKSFFYKKCWQNINKWLMNSFSFVNKILCCNLILPVIVIQANYTTCSRVTLGSWDFPVGKSSTTLCGSPAMFTRLYSPLQICCNSCCFFNNIGTSTKYHLVSTAKLLWSIDTLFFYFFASKSKYLYLFQSK